jgi:hypothetical protein
MKECNHQNISIAVIWELMTNPFFLIPTSETKLKTLSPSLPGNQQITNSPKT